MQVLPSKPPFPRQLNALCYCPDARINRVPLVLELHNPIKQRPKWDGKTLDKLVVFELRFRILVLRERHVDADMDHVEIGVTESGVYG